MTTPPTPAEVAEARTFLTGVETGSTEGFLLDLKHSEVYRRHAAVLVRAALAAPAEQPREDDPLREFAGWLISMDDPEDVNGREERRIVTLTTIISNARAALTAARSVSPSAVPVVSAGGAGRDLTAADIRDSYVLLLEAGVPTHEERQFVAEHLNAIARPADTVSVCHACGMGDSCPEHDSEAGTQATEQTTEYRVAMDFGPRWMAVTADEAAAELRGGRRVEQRSVSPWSPVDVHNENGAQR